MKISTINLVTAYLILFLSISVSAQSGGNFTVTQSVIAGGGNASSGNGFSVTGTIGQSAAGTTSSGGAFSLSGGFWTAPSNGGGLAISGQITSNGSALPGVLVSLSGSSANTATTDSSGNYSFANLAAGGNYTVTPALTNYAFTPINRQFSNLLTNQTANFTAATQSCAFSINPSSINAPAGGATGTISVTTTAGCNWTAVSNDNWISVTSASSNTNAGTTSYSVDANNGASRSRSITIAGQTFTVNQAAGLSISGEVIYGTTPVGQLIKFVFGVNLIASGAPQLSAITDASGFYQISGLSSGGNYTVTPTKTGNINGITPFDATLVLRCVAAGPTNCTLTDNQKLAADTNDSNTITPFDATQILRFVAANQQTNATGQVGNWKFNPAARNYFPLNNSLSGQNYAAILIGEVNGSWTPAN